MSYNGIINVYKEKGYTSHDVVAKLRGILRMKKIGHTGTLDPDACGVLPVCLGNATKVCDMLTDKDKTYEAVLLLGKTTDTQDISGSIQKECQVSVSQEEVKNHIMQFTGSYSQIPPMYSAIKRNGKKLYELAREGIVVERAAREVTIYEITILKIDLPRVHMRVSCSKGTYIRTLCHDIGNMLGCGGCMEELLRTNVSSFSLENALTLKQIEEFRDYGTLEGHILPVEEIFKQYPPAIIKKEFSKLLYNGNPVLDCHFTKDYQKTTGTWLRLYDSNHVFIGIYQYHQEKRAYYPIKMFLP